MDTQLDQARNRIIGLMSDVVTRPKPVETFEEFDYRDLRSQLDQLLAAAGLPQRNPFRTLGEWRGYAKTNIPGSYRTRREYVRSLYFGEVTQEIKPPAPDLELVAIPPSVPEKEPENIIKTGRSISKRVVGLGVLVPILLAVIWTLAKQSGITVSPVGSGVIAGRDAISAGRDVNIFEQKTSENKISINDLRNGYLNYKSPGELLAALSALSFEDQESMIDRFKGKKVKWPLQVVSISPGRNNAGQKTGPVFLRDKNFKDSNLVWAYLEDSSAGVMGKLHKDDKVMVAGAIVSIRDEEIILRDCTLEDTTF